jgi:lathosterol oxidase
MEPPTPAPSSSSDAPSPHDHLSSVDNLPTKLGSGWTSGVLSIVLGIVGLGAVICFHFPNLFTMPELREKYPVEILRAVLHLVLVAAFLLAMLSLVLRERKLLGLTGATLVLIAALLGGSRVVIDDQIKEKGFFLGLDWFLLNLIYSCAVFIPMERLFARLPDQPIFRRGFVTDFTYFLISTLAVQLTTYLTIQPATALFQWAVSPKVHAFVQNLPWVVQFLVIMLSVDIIQYWVHRVLHTVPWLWKFHAVHHSTDAMDWLAGSRLHLVEQVFTRTSSLIPAVVLGFHHVPVIAYLIFISFHATFIHANVKIDWGPLDWLFVTPRFHHWHHAIEREAIDKNFAVHFPVLDLLFGTYYLPGNAWPSGYGIHDKVPSGWLRQFFYPFIPKAQSVQEDTPTVEVHE